MSRLLPHLFEDVCGLGLVQLAYGVQPAYRYAMVNPGAFGRSPEIIEEVQKMLALHIYVQVPRWLQIVEPLTIRIVRQRILAALRRLPGIEIPVRCL